MIRFLAIGCALLMTACAATEVMPALERGTRVQLEPITVDIDGKEYEVRRNEVRFDSGNNRMNWAIVKDGKVISCFRPDVGSCRDALERATLDNRGGGMY